MATKTKIVKTTTKESKKWRQKQDDLYLPQSPVFICKDPLETSIGVDAVDIVDQGHQAGDQDLFAQNSKEDISRKLGKQGHASYGR